MIFREIHPTRTFKKEYKNYRRYKKHLQKDFNSRCGYTDCPDKWFGGPNNFQIDHLRPKKHFPELLNDYNNLVYCCSYVNQAKLDDITQDYLDPCDVDYNEHFERDDDGGIIPKKESLQAQYMFLKLDLGLTRYKLIWKLDQLDKKIKSIETQLQDYPVDGSKIELEQALNELYKKFHDYTNYLHNELSP